MDRDVYIKGSECPPNAAVWKSLCVLLLDSGTSWQLETILISGKYIIVFLFTSLFTISDSRINIELFSEMVKLSNIYLH